MNKFAQSSKTMSSLKQRVLTPISVLLCVLSIVCLFRLLLFRQTVFAANPLPDSSILESFDQHVQAFLQGNPEMIDSKKNVYTLSDSQLTAPQPDPERFAQTSDPSDLGPFLQKARQTLGLRSPLFSVDTPVKEGSSIHYYLDETIFAVTWKQVLHNCTYTFSEVKIAHPSQIRRFFSEGTFGSAVLHTTTEMAQTVNAVVASSGDYYGYRSIGIVVNDGVVYRSMGHYLDTCFIDDNGDLLFAYAGQLTTQEAVQDFVDARNIRFSLSFGPVLLLNGEYCVPEQYNSGEINTYYARAAICQMDSLHYILITANMEPPNHSVPTVGQFTRTLQQLGIPKAYALDGGQTAAIAMNGKLINTVSYGSQREISDIVYFATALPEATMP